MNRRRFLAGLGAALATVAVTTRLGQSALPKIPKYIETWEANIHLTDPDAWFIITDNPEGLKRYERKRVVVSKPTLAFYGSAGL